MTEAVAGNIWLGIGAYAGIGGLVALLIQLGAMQRFDPLAAAAPWRVRLLVTPGLMALWPLILARLATGKRR